MFDELQRNFRKNFLLKPRDPEWVIAEFRSRIVPALESNIRGMYIIGSFALEDFNPNLSDLDFIVSLEKELTEEEIMRIGQVHTGIEQLVLQPNLNGIYLPEACLGRYSRDIPQLTYFHEGALKTDHNKAQYYEIHPITWAELAGNAVTVFGKSREALGLQVDWADVDAYLHENINSYWKGWMTGSANPRHSYYYSTMFRASENEWCVSGVARQLYTLMEQDIASKRRACEYLLDKVPPGYTSVLRDAVNYRKSLPTRPGWRQKKETQQFLAYCIERFNEVYTGKYGNETG